MRRHLKPVLLLTLLLVATIPVAADSDPAGRYRGASSYARSRSAGSPSLWAGSTEASMGFRGMACSSQASTTTPNFRTRMVNLWPSPAECGPSAFRSAPFEALFSAGF